MSRRKSPSAARRLVAVFVYLVFLALALEAASRTYWTVKEGVPFFRTGRMVYAFYPELEPAAEAEITRDDGYYDVLLLGGSVLNRAWSSVEPMLLEQLTVRLGREVRVWNMAMICHTSLDSLHKYRRLAHQRFDAVVFYHALNELRANNCPPEMFRDDYTHYAWYYRVGNLDQHRELPYTALPYTLRFLNKSLRQAMGYADYVPRNHPREEWLAYGSEIRTAVPLRHNLEAIAALADQRGERLVLCTYAYHLPEDYSLERFLARQLDYTLHVTPVEVIGRPDNVRKGLEVHNAVIAGASRMQPNIVFVDQQRLLPKRRVYFNDICHLTQRGSQRFVDNLVDALAAVD